MFKFINSVVLVNDIIIKIHKIKFYNKKPLKLLIFFSNNIKISIIIYSEKNMYLQNMQKYNEFVYECENDKSLKKILLDDMKLSIRSISAIKNAKDTLTVNGFSPPKDNCLKKGDIIKITLSDEHSNYESRCKDLKILYEDEDILVIDKPAFMVVHPTKSHLKDTLLNYVQAIFEKKNIKSKVRFVSRLDRDTSGIITIAKNSYSHYALSQGFASKYLKKYYTAIVNGSMKYEKSTINLKIAKSDDGIKRIISDDGQEAITHYSLIKNAENYSIVKLLLETGRTHQIRVHLNAIGNPIIGDELYFQKSSLISRQALHCSQIDLVSPRSMNKITIHSDLPEDMLNLINMLK